MLERVLLTTNREWVVEQYAPAPTADETGHAPGKRSALRNGASAATQPQFLPKRRDAMKLARDTARAEIHRKETRLQL